MIEKFTMETHGRTRSIPSPPLPALSRVEGRGEGKGEGVVKIIRLFKYGSGL